MNWALNNGLVAIRVDSKGAELQSLCRAEREYLWQPGAEIWDRHSLLLFPNAGRISRDRVKIEGREYPMTMHGFAKDMEFYPISVSEDSLTLELRDTPETHQRFPYAFSLQVAYRLEENRVVQSIRVENTGEKPLFFGLGLHPGFYCPIDLDEGASDYILQFNCPQTLRKIVLDPVTRLCTHRRLSWITQTSEIPLNEGFFDEGPFTTEGYTADSVCLFSRKSGRYLRMGISGFPFVTYWGNPGQMNLICIEPWCGLSDDMDSNHVWEEKAGNTRLNPKEVWTRKLWFEMG